MEYNYYGVCHSLKYDELLYESDKFVVVKYKNKIHYLYKNFHKDSDGDILKCYCPFRQDDVPQGLLWLIEELLGSKING